MECKDCCESVDGLPATGACPQCLDEKEQALAAIEYAKSISTILDAMLGTIKERTEK